MFFLERLNVLYEQYKRCERIELEIEKEKWPNLWRSGNSNKSKEEWKQSFYSEVLTVYPEFKAYCMELQARTMGLEDELRGAKLRIYELEEKLNGKKD